MQGKHVHVQKSKANVQKNKNKLLHEAHTEFVWSAEVGWDAVSARRKGKLCIVSAFVRAKLNATSNFWTFLSTHQGLSCAWRLSGRLCCFMQLQSLCPSFCMTMVFDGEGGMLTLWRSHRNSGCLHLGEWLTIVFLQFSVFRTQR